MIGRNRGLETWELSVVDGDILPMEEGSATDEWRVSSPSPHSLQVQLREHPGDLRGQRLRGDYICNKGRYTVGTWLATGLERSYGDTNEGTWTLSAVDTTLMLFRTHLRRAVTLPRGAGVIESARNLLTSYFPNETLAAVDTDATLRVPLSWEVGVPLLTVLSEIVAVGGHMGIHATALGDFTAPLIGAPGRKPVLTWSDEQTEFPFEPQLTLSDRLFDVPNEVLAISPGSDTSPGLTGRWGDETAIAKYGRHTVSIRVEAANQEAANALARQHAMQVATTELTVTAPWEPLRSGDAVGLNWSEKGIVKLATLVGWSQNWVPGAETTYTLQEG